MAIPADRLSTVLQPGLYLSPDDLNPSYLVDYELGGIALNDASKGLKYQIWTLRLVVDDVIVSAPEYPDTVLFTRSDITELALAFDQNMNPFVAFVENGVAKFWWFDTLVSMTIFTNLPAGSRTPRCCMDDKRVTQDGFSDIILAYIGSNDVLYHRNQRDRYTVEHSDRSGVIGRLQKIGMNTVNRLQWTIQDPLPPGFIC